MNSTATNIYKLTEGQKWMLRDIGRQIKEHSIEDIDLINYWLKPLKLKLNAKESA